MAATPIPILYQDEQLLLVDKPAGMAVHRSRLVGADDVFMIDRVREQVEGPLHLIHRLDRATSGVLLIARNGETAAALGKQFMARTVEKTYLAVCRGWPEETGTLDYDLPGVRDNSERKSAITHWRRLHTIEVPIAINRYEQQRYALVEVNPETGRYRQIRRHFAHLRHPLIGDTSHGRSEHNRLFKQYYGTHRLLLHAATLVFEHPLSAERLRVEAPLDQEFSALLRQFDWSHPLATAPAAVANHA